MNRYAILLGSAPAGFTQEKIVKMHDFLVSQDGGRFNEKEIMILPNGADEKMLLFVMQNLKEQGGNTKLDYFLLYICTDYAAEAEEKSFFLCGEEIKRNIIEKAAAALNGQVLFDFGKNVIADCKDDEDGVLA